MGKRIVWPGRIVVIPLISLMSFGEAGGFTSDGGLNPGFPVPDVALLPVGSIALISGCGPVPTTVAIGMMLACIAPEWPGELSGGR